VDGIEISLDCKVRSPRSETKEMRLRDVDKYGLILKDEGMQKGAGAGHQSGPDCGIRNERKA
jgi:hypothetical protein